MASRYAYVASVASRMEPYLDGRLVFCAGLLSQALYFLLVPWQWGWDSTGYMAIGRMYQGLPFQMWDVKDYYPMGYPVWLSLMGVHSLDTMLFLKISTLLMGALMPLLIYAALKPSGQRTAAITALVFCLFFSNALFSTDIMTSHLHHFTLLLMFWRLTRYCDSPTIRNAILLALATVAAYAVRQVVGYIFIIALCGVAYAGFQQRWNWWIITRRVLVALLAYQAVLGIAALGRQSALHLPRYEMALTRDYGFRVLFQGVYYGAHIYFMEHHPNEDSIFVRPENGPASTEMFSRVRTAVENYGAAPLDQNLVDNGARDAATTIETLVNRPNHWNTYFFWWKLGSTDEIDALYRRVVIETVIANPRILKYFIWNMANFMFGPNIMIESACIRCACPCFHDETLTHYVPGGFMEAEFASIASPRVIAEMKREYGWVAPNARYIQFAYDVAQALFPLKPLLSILALLSPFLTRGRARWIALFCLGTVLVMGATTSLAWPAQLRYWFPAYPFLLICAALSLAEAKTLYARATERWPALKTAFSSAPVRSAEGVRSE